MIERREIKTDTRTIIVYGKPRHEPKRSMLFGGDVPMVNNAINQAKPLESVGLSVHRNQVAEFNQMYADAKIVGAHHKADGTLVLESRQARNAVLKLRGARDNDACYGDYGGEHN